MNIEKITKPSMSETKYLNEYRLSFFYPDLFGHS